MQQPSAWPATAVVIAVCAMIAVMMVSAIGRYSTPDEALKVWASFDALVGLLSGAAATYFFTKRAADSARAETTSIKEMTSASTARLQAAHDREFQSMAALIATAGQLTPEVWEDRLKTDPALVGLFQLAREGGAGAARKGCLLGER